MQLRALLSPLVCVCVRLVVLVLCTIGVCVCFTLCYNFKSISIFLSREVLIEDFWFVKMVIMPTKRGRVKEEQFENGDRCSKDRTQNSLYF